MIEQIRKTAEKKILYLPHALKQMNRPERMISVQEIRKVIFAGQIIEDYPEDARGHSCLLLGYGDMGRALHLVCSPKEDYLAIITAYIPRAAQWSADFKTRSQR